MSVVAPALGWWTIMEALRQLHMVVKKSYDSGPTCTHHSQHDVQNPSHHHGAFYPGCQSSDDRSKLSASAGCTPISDQSGSRRLLSHDQQTSNAAPLCASSPSLKITYHWTNDLG